MGYIKRASIKVGDEVILTKQKESIAGYFEIGTRVKIVAKDESRGYTFEDEDGNIIIEAGFDGFQKI